MNVESKMLKCRNCGHEIMRGIWFDPRGEVHRGSWVHVAGGVLCAAGGLAQPPKNKPGVQA